MPRALAVLLLVLMVALGLVALLWPVLSQKPSILACFATLTVVDAFREPFNMISGRDKDSDEVWDLTCPHATTWFIGDMILFIIVHPPVAVALRALERLPFCGGVVGFLALAMAFVASVVISGYESVFPVDYTSFLMGAILGVFAPATVKLVPSLCLDAPCSTCSNPKPMLRTFVGALADLSMLAFVGLVVHDAAVSTPHDHIGSTNSHRHLASIFVSSFLLFSCSTGGAGITARLLRAPLLRTIGSIALEIYVLSPGVDYVFYLFGLAKDDEVFVGNSPPVLYMMFLVMFAHGLCHQIIQPLLN